MKRKETSKHRLKSLVQVGVVVRDLDRTVERLSTTFGIGPWQHFDWPLDRDDMTGTYREKPGHFRMRTALVKLGHVELELIQPLEGDNIYSDFLEEKGEGIHHLRFDIPDVETALESWAGEGIKIIQSGTAIRPGTKWAYLNTAELPGFGGITFELLTKFYEGDEPPPRPKLSEVAPGVKE